MTKFGYARVSTASQYDNYSIEIQKEKLIKEGVKEKDIFVDVQTGTEMMRDEFTKLVEKVETGDSIIVTRMDRFSRTFSGAIPICAQLKEKGVQLVCLDAPGAGTEGVGELFMMMILWLAESDYKGRKARQSEGIAKAKADKKYKGRKSRITPELKKKIKEFIDVRNYRKVDLPGILHVSRSTIYRALKEMNDKK